MTARRSSATERRGVGITPRPAALSAAVLAVVMAGSGCASRNANTVGMAAPVNQDTAAVAKDGGLPHTPPAAMRMAIEGSVTALPSTTSTLPPGNPGDPPTKLGDTIKAEMNPSPLTIGLTPEANPASPKPVLEVVGMPTWLWIEGLPPALTVTYTPAAGAPITYTAWAALDSVTWDTDSADGPTFTCGNGTYSPSPGQGYGVPYAAGWNPTSPGAVPNACVTTFRTPYYATSNGSPTAGVYTLTGKVAWHVAYTVTVNSATGPTLSLGANYSGTALTKTTQIRVGEIQALAITP